ncbi:MAG: formylglycine-generating enzyme family protein [Verrucomicrobiales bacterium]
MPAETQPDPVILWPDQPHTMTFRFIPPGRFLMGSRGNSTNEEPRHWVAITRAFWIAETPVTRVQYRFLAQSCAAALAAIEGHPGPEPSECKGDDRHPVDSVNWFEAAAIGEWLTGSEELKRHCDKGITWAGLPTEAQWEYVCRAGTTSDYHTGDGVAALDQAGWYEANSSSSTQPVRLKAPNLFGLFDMHGNVWEWCRDAWNDDAYKQRPHLAPDPRVDEKDTPLRVVRGGSWFYTAGFCRSAFRYWWRPLGRFRYQGFRLCLSSGPVEDQPASGRDGRFEPEAAPGQESEARDEPETEGRRSAWRPLNPPGGAVGTTEPRDPDGNHEKHETHEKPRRCPIITVHLMDEEVACPNPMSFRVFRDFRGSNVPFWAESP